MYYRFLTWRLLGHWPWRRLAALTAVAVLALLTGSCAASPGASDRGAPEAKRGVLDLRQWNPEKNEPVALAGEWLFFWHQLVDPKAGCETTAKKPDLVRLPSRWTGQVVGGETLGATGYASYCLTLLLPPRQQPLSLFFPRAKTAAELWIDGRLAATSGTVGTNAEDSRPVRRDQVVAFSPSTRMHLVLRVSNFHFRNGGADKPLLLGSPNDIRSPLAKGGTVRSAFFVGAFLILGLYHIVLHLLRRQMVAPLAFGLLCLVMAAYELTCENNLFAAVFPFVPWAIEIRLEYTLFALSPPLAALFAQSIYPREFSRRLTVVCTALTLLFLALIWLTPILLSSQWTLLAYQGSLLPITAYAVWRMAVAVSRHRPGAHWFLIGTAVWLGTGLGDGLLLRYLPQLPNLLPYGFMALVVAHAILLAMVLSQSANQAERLSTRLLSLASEKLALEREAYRDPLTGLENRRRLDLDVQVLRERAPGDGHVSLLYLDVDDFKQFNDRYGHDVGDEILIELAQRIRQEVRGYDLSVRLGGDEFVVLLPDVDRQGAERQAQRLRQSFQEPMVLGGHELLVSVSIGIATVAADHLDLRLLLRRADADMYRHKRTERARAG